ncbi:MAG TPA: nitroreductase family deazaflavin-dependent oxidoreductase [Acidimicrobiia bacterium]|nr:nitroreductase family deazaflavin-dependent oxidoreductase [Acidimicrobiia bacterium]
MRALETDRVIDITTTGRRSGEPRRIEMWFHNLDGPIYITGMPGKRSRYASLHARRRFVFHIKHSTTADLAAEGRPITDESERCSVFGTLLDRLGHADNVEAWMTCSPRIEVPFA